MTMAVEDEVHPAVFQSWNQHRAHVAHDPLSFFLVVRVVRAFGVRWMMPVGDAPVLAIRCQIRLEPFQHRAIGGAITASRIEADEMGITMIRSEEHTSELQ